MSCSVDQLAVLMAITPLIIVPLMLFGGYFLNSEYVDEIRSKTKCRRRL